MLGIWHEVYWTAAVLNTITTPSTIETATSKITTDMVITTTVGTIDKRNDFQEKVRLR